MNFRIFEVLFLLEKIALLQMRMLSWIEIGICQQDTMRYAYLDDL